MNLNKRMTQKKKGGGRGGHLENMVGLSGLMSGWVVRGVGGWSVERVGDLRSGWMDG